MNFELFFEYWVKSLMGFTIILVSVGFAWLMYQGLPPETLVPKEALSILWPWSVGAGTVMALQWSGLMNVSRYDSTGDSDG